jgi:hypothetical protein
MALRVGLLIKLGEGGRTSLEAVKDEDMMTGVGKCLDQTCMPD